MRRHIVQSLVCFAFATVLVSGFQNCGYIANPIDSNLLAGLAINGSLGYSRAVGFDDVARDVFANSCVSCHSSANAMGGYNLSTYASALKDVDFSNLNGSKLIARVRDGSMPMSGPALTDSQKQTIYDWVLSGAGERLPAASAAPVISGKASDQNISLSSAQPSKMIELFAVVVDPENVVDRYVWNQVSGPSVAMSGADSARMRANYSSAGTYAFDLSVYGQNGQMTSQRFNVTVSGSTSSTPTPTASPTPTATPSTPQATYSWLRTNVFSPKCAACHSMMTTHSTLVSNPNWVRSGNAATSGIYTRTSNGTMPVGSSALTAAQVSAIQTWINGGAPNN